MPMEVGALRNCCWYACAAATPELALPVEDPVGLLPLVVLPLLGLLVLLLLHAAMDNADIPAMTTARVFLIPGLSLARARTYRATGVSNSTTVNFRLLSWFST
jgi:hypothetical protein